MNFSHSNSGEFATIKTRMRLDRKTSFATISTSIPAKPLVQAKLKRGGFFVPKTLMTP